MIHSFKMGLAGAIVVLIIGLLCVKLATIDPKRRLAFWVGVGVVMFLAAFWFFVIDYISQLVWRLLP